MLPILFILTQYRKNRKASILFGFAIIKRKKYMLKCPSIIELEGISFLLDFYYKAYRVDIISSRITFLVRMNSMLNTYA